METIAPTKQSARKTLYAAFKVLNENGNEMRRKEILDAISQRVSFEPWELEHYESNGQLKWRTIFLFYTVDCIKAGWLIKNKGVWYLTPEGQEAMKLGPEKLLEAASKAYREWKSNEDKATPKTNELVEKDIDINDEVVQKATLDELEAQARDGIGKYLENMGAYKFQKICGVLLKAMGLFVEYEAPPGPDGGIDIIAYKDQLGFEKPRIKVQVKNHNESIKVDVKPVRELKGLLNANEHAGIFITSGFYTKDAETFARNSDIHIKLIDRIEFIELWTAYYPTLAEDEKALLPLHPIYFLGNIE
jgi:restriction system protein